MAGVIGDLMGKDGLTEMICKHSGDLVEKGMKNILTGGSEKKEEEEKEEDKGGLDPGKIVRAVMSGDKEEEEGGGLDVKNMLGKIF